MKIVQCVVAIIDVISFCIWMFVVIGIGNTEEFALGVFFFIWTPLGYLLMYVNDMYY